MLGGGLKGLKAKNGELHDFTFSLFPTSRCFLMTGCAEDEKMCVLNYSELRTHCMAYFKNRDNGFFPNLSWTSVLVRVFQRKRIDRI
jgi:hypothetical protein